MTPRKDHVHPSQEIPASAYATAHIRPIVAIVGRPNVGKSTLFNRLVGTRIAIVHDVPGVTRDRNYADAEVQGIQYTLVDTGGFDPESDDPMRQGIVRQINVAIEEADVIVCVLDATTECTSADIETIRLLRESNKSVIYVANKADAPHFDALAFDLYRLGISHVIPISAAHGRNISDFEEALVPLLPRPDADAHLIDPFAALQNVPRVALIGRPNAGKSSLLNRLLGYERALVDSRPGTTRDTLDVLVHYKVNRAKEEPEASHENETGSSKHEQPLIVLDTAGIRRKSKVYDLVEATSVLRAIRAIERAEVVVLMCDAVDGVAEQDAKIAGLAVERGRALIIALNKCDELDAKAQKKAEENALDKLTFAPWAPVVRLSAKTGRGVGRLVETIARVRSSWVKRVTTGEMNRFFEGVLETHPPPTMNGKFVRLYYITQAEASPPTFVVITNQPDFVHFSYQRYIANQIRSRFGFEGTPIQIVYRAKRKKELK